MQVNVFAEYLPTLSQFNVTLNYPVHFSIRYVCQTQAYTDGSGGGGGNSHTLSLSFHPSIHQYMFCFSLVCVSRAH